MYQCSPAHRRWLLWILLGLGLTVVLGGHHPRAAATTLPTIDRVTQDTRHYWLENGSPQTLDAVRALPAEQWRRIDDGPLNLGLDQPPVWVRLTLRTSLPTPETWLLEIGYPVLDQVQLWLVQGDRIVTAQVSGDSRPYADRPFSHPNIVFPLTLAEGDQEVFLRVETTGALQVPLHLLSPTQMLQRDQTFLLGQGLFYGIAGVMVFYNAVLFFILRDRSYLYYILAVGSHALFQASILGFGFQYLWPNLPVLNQIATPFSLCLFGLSMPLFTLHFLRLQQGHPWLKAWLLAYAGLSGLLLVSVFLLPYRLVIQVTIVTNLLGCLLALVTGLISLHQGLRHARYFVLAWAAFLIAVVALGLNKIGWLPINFLTQYAGQIGSALEMVLLSFALADRFNAQRQATLEAEQQALANARLAHSEQEQLMRFRIKSKEDELQARRKLIEAEAESKAKSEILATMSHEMRTPMNGVIGMASLLRETTLTSRQKHYVTVIDHSARSLLDIINDVLDYAKINAGRMVLETVPFSVDQLCAESVSLFALAAEEKGLEFEVFIDPACPDSVIGDPTRIRQVLLNLLGNAFKFTEQGRVELTVSCPSCTADTLTQGPQESPKAAPLEIRFAIRDTGIGIAREVQGRLFTAFVQADQSTTRRFGGTGLGLSICRQLVELMRGEIGLESQERQGSCFWFTLPLKPLVLPAREGLSAAEVDANQTREARQAIARRAQRATLAGRRILLLDPGQRLLQMLEPHFAQWKMQVTPVESPDALLETCRDRFVTGLPPFDAILLRQRRPDCDAIALLPALIELHARHKQQDPPILGVVSSLRRLQDIENAESPPDFVLTLPLTPGRLLETLLTAFNRRSASQWAGTGTLALTINGSDTQTSVTSYRVLVADDNPVNLMVIDGMLKRLGLQATLRNDGAAALRAVNEATEPFDLILMDCEMPEMDGLEATRRIRALERERHWTAASILALTAHRAETLEAVTREAGMNGFLVKPLELSRLRRVIYELRPQPPDLEKVR